MSALADETDGGPETPAPSHSKQSLRLWLRLLRCATVVEKTVRNRLTREFATTLPRFDVLAALHRHPGGMTMSELSGHLLVSNGNVTGLVNRLQADGLVKREALAADRRTFRVELTDRGKAAFAEVAAAHEGWIDDMFGGLSDTEIQQLLDLLERAGRSLEDSVSREDENGG